MNASDYNERLKTGRNEPCPCGSGKKYKKCHLAEDEAAKHADFVKAAKEREEAAAAAEAAEKEENGENTQSQRNINTRKNIHDHSGSVKKSKGGKQNIPRRGAI